MTEQHSESSDRTDLVERAEVELVDPEHLDEQPVEPAIAEAAPVSNADEDVDLHDLVDAPSHADEVIERLTEAFPGAELQTKESTEEP